MWTAEHRRDATRKGLRYPVDLTDDEWRLVEPFTPPARQLREASGGISGWARRARELRNGEGYQILSHNDRSALKPGEYILEPAKPEPTHRACIG